MVPTVAVSNPDRRDFTQFFYGCDHLTRRILQLLIGREPTETESYTRQGIFIRQPDRPQDVTRTRLLTGASRTYSRCHVVHITKQLPRVDTAKTNVARIAKPVA